MQEYIANARDAARVTPVQLLKMPRGKIPPSPHYSGNTQGFVVPVLVRNSSSPGGKSVTFLGCPLAAVVLALQVASGRSGQDT